jgi:hypothetical protein
VDGKKERARFCVWRMGSFCASSRGRRAIFIGVVFLLAVLGALPDGDVQAAITYRSKSQAGLNFTTDLTVNKPAGTVTGDLMIATIADDGIGDTLGAPAGWTLIQPASPGGEQMRNHSWYRVAQVGEGTSYTFTSSGGGDNMIGQIVTFYQSTGVDGTAWVLNDSSYVYQSFASNSITTSSVTGVAGGLLYTAFVNDDNETITSAPAGMTNLYVQLQSSLAMATYYQAVGAGGVTKSATWSGGPEQLSAVAAIFSWVPSGPTTTIGNGSAPSNVTLPPGATITDLDQLTFVTSAGTDTVTALTVTLGPAGAYNNIARVDITDTGNVARCTAVTNPASNTVTFSTCTSNGGLPVTTSSTTYKVLITPKTHANMPVPPGASYATTGTVTAFTSTNTQAGTDSSSATVTIDNLSPNGATSVSGTAGDTANTLNWTTSNSGDFNATSGSVILRWAAASAGAEVPAEGSTYSAGNTIATATVACVISSAGSTAVSKIDGTGGSAGCTTTALTNGQAYTYKVFQRDTSGSYDVGVVIGTFTWVPANPTQIHYRWRNDDGPEFNILNVALICATAACTDANIDVPLKNHLIALGHNVTTYIDTNTSWTPTNYDVVVISESTLSVNSGWLKNIAVPILTVEGQNWDEYDMGTGGDSNLGGSLDIDITDNTHYITSVFPLGVLTINNAGTDTNNDLGYMAGWANGVKKLANYTSNTSWARLTYVDKGGALVTSGTAAERRVFFGARYFGQLNSDGVKIFDRSLQWVSYFGAGATFMADEDAPVTGYPKLTPIRGRVEVSNEGGAATGAMTYRLEYARSTSGPWTTVPTSATSEEWEMADSTFITDGQITQNISPGLTDENTTFVAGQLKDTGATTSAITLSSTQFTELEYSIRATNNSTNCQTYFFRVTDAGATTNFTFTVYPQITVAGSPACIAPVPVGNLTITAYSSQNTITWDNPSSNYTQIIVLAKTADCSFTTTPTGIEAINATVGTGVVIFNNNPSVDMPSTSVTVGSATTVTYTASTQRLVHSGLTDGTVYCYKVYARNGDLMDDNSGAGRPSVTATGTNGVAPSAVWSFNLISSAGSTLVQPSLDPGAFIYTSYGSGTLTSMGASNGLLTWRATPASGAIQDQSAVVWMSGSSTCGLAGATNCIFATSQDGYLYARNAATGVAAWSYRHAAGDMLQGAPSVQIKDYSNSGYTPTVDRLFAATRNATTSANKVYALNPTVAPSTPVWLFTGGGANPAMDMVSAPPVLDYTNNRIYVTSNSNGGTQRSLWVFSTVTGALLSTGTTYGGTSPGDVQVAPALSIDGSVVYVGTTAGASSTVQAYSTGTGAFLWSFSTGSPVVSGLWVEWRAGLANNLFFTTANGKVWRIKDNGTSATDLWGAGAPTLTSASFPVVIPSAGKVYVGGCSGASCSSGSQAKLYQLAVSTGTKEQCRILGSNITPGDPALDTVLEQLLVGGSDGKIHTYAAPAGLLGGDPSCTP